MLEMMSQLGQRMDRLESAGQPGKGQGTGQQGIHSRGSATPEVPAQWCATTVGRLAISAVDVQQHPRSRETGSPRVNGPTPEGHAKANSPREQDALHVDGRTLEG